MDFFWIKICIFTNQKNLKKYFSERKIEMRRGSVWWFQIPRIIFPYFDEKYFFRIFFLFLDEKNLSKNFLQGKNQQILKVENEIKKNTVEPNCKLPIFYNDQKLHSGEKWTRRRELIFFRFLPQENFFLREKIQFYFQNHLNFVPLSLNTSWNEKMFSRVLFARN